VIRSKYIIFDDGDKGLPVVFSPLLQHNQVADGKPVISAGYCDVRVKTEGDEKTTEWHVWGKSVSLRKSCRPVEDKEILNQYLRYDCP
jgi:hypothetical protein